MKQKKSRGNHHSPPPPPPRRSHHAGGKPPQRSRLWLLVAASIAVAAGIWAAGRLFVWQGVVVIKDSGHLYQVWIDGELLTQPTEVGWQKRVAAGKHTVTMQSPARQEQKSLITVKPGRTLTLSPDRSGTKEIDLTDATFIGGATHIFVPPHGKYLYFYNREGTVLQRHNAETGATVAVTDRVFRSPTSTSFSLDESVVIVRAKSGNWYSLNLRKNDPGSTAYFRPLGNQEIADLAYDPSRYRVALVAPDPVTKQLALSTAEVDMSNKHLESLLPGLTSPQLIWAPHGRAVVLLDNPSYNESNLYLYNLALGQLSGLPVKNAVRAAYSADGRWVLVEEARGAERWLIVVDTDSNQAREIGRLSQEGMSTWRPDKPLIWAVLADTPRDESDRPALTAIHPDGQRETVGSLPLVDGVWQRIFALTTTTEVYLQSNNELWRVNLAKPSP